MLERTMGCLQELSRKGAKSLRCSVDLDFLVGGGAAAAFEPLEPFADHVELEPVVSWTARRGDLEIDIQFFPRGNWLWKDFAREIAVDHIAIVIEERDAQRNVASVGDRSILPVRATGVADLCL